MSEISLCLDEDVRVLLAEILRNRGYNAYHVLEVERTGKSDSEQLAYAVRNKMAILTHNIKDYVSFYPNLTQNTGKTTLALLFLIKSLLVNF